MDGYSSDADNVTFNGTLNATTDSTTANMPRDGSSTESRDGSIQSYIQGVQTNPQELGPSDSAPVEENEGELGEAEVDMQALMALEQYLRQPLLNVNMHKYEAANSTCPESKAHCCICLDEYFAGEELAKIDCGHIYHIDCIKEWNLLDNTCPLCKRRVSAASLFTVRFRAFLDELAATQQHRDQ